MSQLKFPNIPRNSSRNSVNASPSPEHSPVRHIITKKSFPRITIAESEEPSPLSPEGRQTTSSKISSVKNHRVEFEGESPARYLRPMTMDMQDDEDEVLGGALSKLDEMLRRQALRSEKKKLKDEEDRKDLLESRKSSVVISKNLNSTQRIARYKSIKGITPKANESRFEGRLSLFRDVKTFVDIREIMKGVNSPDMVITPDRSDKMPRESYFKRQAEGKTLRDLYLDIEDDELRLSSSSDNESSTSRSEQASPLHDRLSIAKSAEPQGYNDLKKSTSKEDKLEGRSPKTEKPAPKVSRRVIQAYDELRGQVIKHMGPNIFKEMNRKIRLEPQIVQQLEIKNKEQLEKTRQEQKELQNFKIFNQFVEYLSAEELATDTDQLGINKEDKQDDFYKQMTNKMFPRKDDFDDVAVILERIDKEEKDKSDEEEEEDKRKSPVIMTDFGRIPTDLLNDEQIKMMSALQEYKKRSDKIIAILKNKTQRIHADIKIINKVANVKEKLNSVLLKSGTLTDIGKGGLFSLSRTIPEKDETETDLDKERSPRRFGTLTSTMSFRKTRNDFYSPSSRADNISPSDKGVTWATTNSLQQIMMENKKKYIELKGKGFKKKDFYVGSNKTWTTEGDDLGLKPMTKSARIKNNFNQSVSKIYDDINTVSSSSNNLKLQLKKSMDEVDKYYLQKERYLKPKMVPETLKIPKPEPNFSKRAHLILDLTRDLLKKQR